MRGELSVIGTKRFLEFLSHVNAGPVTSAVREIFLSYPYKIWRVEEIVDFTYHNDSNGGPDDAEGTLRVIIHHLRKSGLSIVVHGHRGYAYEPEFSHRKINKNALYH